MCVCGCVDAHEHMKLYASYFQDWIDLTQYRKRSNVKEKYANNTIPCTHLKNMPKGTHMNTYENLF